ncbi:hypothetical protein THTE_3751 [Thermogutta terrifontis]|uniref:Uncharacterized protein n=1 Tax=Thermogutta terrifontis TaxID=1331910 RepID=A0A286RK95_9BACT|nr:hypothetical protein THTE_3751 [Thermogutta terrifontis]
MWRNGSAMRSFCYDRRERYGRDNHFCKQLRFTGSSQFLWYIPYNSKLWCCS